MIIIKLIRITTLVGSCLNPEDGEKKSLHKKRKEITRIHTTTTLLVFSKSPKQEQIEATKSIFYILRLARF